MSFIGVFRWRPRLAPRGVVWRLFALLALALLAPSRALAITEPLQTHNIEEVGELTTGSTQAVAMFDHYTLVGQGASLRVLDSLDPGHLAFVGALDLGHALARQIAIVGDRAYVATYDHVDRYGLFVVSLADPAHPARLGAWQMAEGQAWWNPTDIAVEGNRVFICCLNAGYRLTILDVSRPEQPILAPLPVAHDVYGMAVRNGWIYCAEGSGLSIIDATKPGQTPEFVKWFQAGDYDYYDIKAAGKHAYGLRLAGQFTVLDLTNPTSPVTQSSIAIPQAACTGQSRLSLAAPFAWISNEQGCWLIDVSDPAAPRLRGSVACAGQPVGRPTLAGNTACLARTNGLQWVGASDPDHPALTGWLYVGVNNPYDIAMHGGWAWMAAQGGCWAVDLTDPAHPRLAGHCSLAGQGYRIAINASGTLACVLSGDTGVQTIDLADPARPKLLASFNLPHPGRVGNVAMKGDIAFIQANATSTMPQEPARLYVYDLSDPARPVLLCTNEALGDLTAMTVGGDLLYGFHADSSYANKKVSIIDISDPAQPTERGVYPDPASSSSSYFYPATMTTDDRRLYLLYDHLGVMTPAGPTELKTQGQLIRTFSADTGSFLKARDGWLACNYYSELRLFDVRDPQAPLLAGTWYAPNYSPAFAFQGDLLVRNECPDNYNQALHLVVLRCRPTGRIQVLSPIGNEIIPVGAPIPVHWRNESTTAGASVRIELWQADYAGSNKTPQRVADLGTFSTPGGEGSQEITLPLKYQGLFRIRVVSVADTTLYGESLDPFIIQADGRVRILAPSGSCVWPAGSVQRIDWEADPLAYAGVSMNFELWRGPVKVENLGGGSSLIGAGSLTWRVPYYLPSGPGYWIKPPGTTATTATTHAITIANDQYSPWNAIRGAHWALYD